MSVLSISQCSIVKLLVLENMCADVILGQDFMGQHKSVVFEFGGSEPSLHISALTAMNVPPPSLFEHLTDDCKPVAVKSRKQTNNNSKFIHEETQITWYHMERLNLILRGCFH